MPVRTPWIAEFRPPRRRVVARAVLGCLVSVVAGGGVLFGASLFWLPRTITYRIADGALTVEARYSVVTERRQVALADVVNVGAVRLGSGRRTFGMAMPGFCVGSYTYAGVGAVWQATNCSTLAVVVRSPRLDRPLVITPPDRKGFRQAMASGTELVVSPIAVAAGDGLAIARWALAAAALGIPSLFVLFFISPGRLRYLVRPGELEVAGLLRRRRLPLTGVTVRRVRPSSVFRLMGTAVPGYYHGLFRMGGATVRVAATHLNEGVLVEGNRGVFVTPEDVDEFLAVLRQAGAVLGPAA